MPIGGEARLGEYIIFRSGRCSCIGYGELRVRNFVRKEDFVAIQLFKQQENVVRISYSSFYSSLIEFGFLWNRIMCD